MRDIVVSLVILALMPVCFRRPFIGLLVFSWLAYMRVQDLAWKFAREIRWSYYVFLITFAGYLVGPYKKRFFRPDPRCYLMLVLVALVWIGIMLSASRDQFQVSRFIEFCKIIIIALFTTALVTDKERLRVLVWVVALSLGFYGVKNGILGVLTAGNFQILRGPGGMLFDNNDFSLALSMAVPMLYYLGWTEPRKAIRRAFFISAPLTAITVALTHSRGGFLSVATALGFLVWRSRNRFAGFTIGFLLAIAAFLVAPEDYKERVRSIADWETESSAQGRLVAWGIAIRMAQDHPFFGVGLYKFRQHFADYIPGLSFAEIGRSAIVAHNSYLQIWAECGTPAFAIYLGLIGWSLWALWKIRREAKRRYYSSWIINYANMFEASLATFMVGSTFLNRAHFDLFYHWVAIIICFDHVAREELAKELSYPERRAGQGAAQRPALRESVPRRTGGYARRPSFPPGPAGRA